MAAALLFGVSTPIAKVLLRDLGPFSLAGLLYLGAAAAVLPFARGVGVVIGNRPRIDRLRLAGVVVFGGVLAPVLLFMGLEVASASTVSLWLNLETAITALLAGLIFREHLGRYTWWAVTLVSLGSLLLVWPILPGTAAGAILVTSACACWAVDNNLTAMIDGITPARSTLVKGLVAGLLNLSLGLVWEQGSWSPGIVVLALAVGALSYGLSLVLHTSGAQHLGAARAQTIFGTAPFWGVVLSWVILSEPWTPAQLVAGGIMGIAVWLMQSQHHGHLHSHAQVEHIHWHRHDDGHHVHPHAAMPGLAWHIHLHVHAAETHSHGHTPDIHHRHPHP